MDPNKEIAALIEAVKAGFMSLSEVQRSLGFIPSEVMEELGQDMANAREKGLALSVDGKASAPSAPVVDAGDTEPEADQE